MKIFAAIECYSERYSAGEAERPVQPTFRLLYGIGFERFTAALIVVIFLCMSKIIQKISKKSNERIHKSLSIGCSSAFG